MTKYELPELTENDHSYEDVTRKLVKNKTDYSYFEKNRFVKHLPLKLTIGHVIELFDWNLLRNEYGHPEFQNHNLLKDLDLEFVSNSNREETYYDGLSDWCIVKYKNKFYKMIGDYSSYDVRGSIHEWFEVKEVTKLIKVKEWEKV